MGCRAATLWAVIFGAAIGKFDLGLSAPAGAREMVKIVVVNDARSTAYPDELVNVGKAAVAARASFVGEEKGVAIDLKVPHALRRTVFAVAVDTTCIAPIDSKRIVANHHATTVVTVGDPVAATDKCGILDIEIGEPGRIPGSHGVRGMPRGGVLRVLDRYQVVVPTSYERNVRKKLPLRAFPRLPSSRCWR